MLNRLRNFLKLNLWATFTVNYKLLGWRAVIDMPFLVYGRVTTDLSGRVELSDEMIGRRGVVVIGSRHETYYASSGKFQLSVLGVWRVTGRIKIGVDSCVYIGKNAILSTGDNIYIARDSQIHCMDSIAIGDNVLMGEVYITDSASHSITRGNNVSPMTKPISIGHHSYTGFRTMILKGCQIPPYSVVGSGAVCTRNYVEEVPDGHVLLTGIPASVKEHGVTPDTVID